MHQTRKELVLKEQRHEMKVKKIYDKTGLALISMNET